MTYLYVASSWRNKQQPEVVRTLRTVGFEVYDFRNPEPDNHGFAWAQIDPNWEQWSLDQYLAALKHPIAEAGYALDWDAMLRADAGVLVLPSGRSAHLEAGYFVGAGKPLYILWTGDEVVPELMYKMATGLCKSLADLLIAMGKWPWEGDK